MKRLAHDEKAEAPPLTAEQFERAEAAIRDLLAADSVLPEQFWGTHAAPSIASGELALMWAVFADGIESYRRNAVATSAHGRVEFEEAESWVLATDWDWPFSFVNLCDVFGFNANGIRWALRRWRHEQRVGARPGPRRRFRPMIRAA
jgi:hypothetical protein